MPAAWLGLLVSCGDSTPSEAPVGTKTAIHYDNIMVYSDLSSRLRSNPNDTVILAQVIDYFIDDCVKPGVKINDRSSILYSRINYHKSDCPSKKIDIGTIPDLTSKQKFVNDNSPDGGLTQAIGELRDAIRCNYRERDKDGLDILSLLFLEVNAGYHLKDTVVTLSDERDTILQVYRNHLVLFTDGYLEYATAKGSKDFYFGKKQIEAVRKYCKSKQVTPEEAIRDNPRFRIRPLPSPNNRLVRLYVLETDDRGLNARRGTVLHTGELSDNHILQLVWKDWAERSGFRHFEWKQKTTPTNLPQDFIRRIFQG